MAQEQRQRPYAEELALLEKQLDDLDKRIERLRAQMRPDLTSEHFVGGRVGGSGNPIRMARLNRQRERQLDKHVDASVELTCLLRERKHLEDVINILLTRPSRRRAVEEYARRTEDAVRSAGVGCKVETALFGVVTVVRINAKSVTVETPSGHRERLSWGMVGRVVK